MPNTLDAQKINFSEKSKFQSVNGIQISYYEKGYGDPILFIHGIPSNSEIWKEIIDTISRFGRAIAIDLPGYGKSDIPKNNDFNLITQFNYVKGFIDSLKLKNLTLIVHDLGSLYGVKYAVENEGNVKQIVLIESVFMPTKLWYKQLPASAKLTFALMKNSKISKKWIVEKIKLTKLMLKMGTKKKLTNEEIKKYTKGFDENVKRRDILISGPSPSMMPKRGISIKKGDFADEFDKNATGLKLLSETKPLLIIYADPGMVTRKKAIKYAKSNFKNLTLSNIGKGKHFLQIDQPKKINNEIVSWLKLKKNKS